MTYFSNISEKGLLLTYYSAPIIVPSLAIRYILTVLVAPLIARGLPDIATTRSPTFNLPSSNVRQPPLALSLNHVGAL